MSITIPGRDTASLLQYEAKRRPILAEMMDRARFLTDHEIAQAPLPLPWMRKALTQMRNDLVARETMMMSMATIDDHIVEMNSNDPQGDIVVFDGIDFFMRGRMMIEVRAGTLVFLPESGGVWIDHSFFPQVDQRLLEGARMVERGNRDRYKQVRTERLLRLNGDAPIIDLTGQNSGSQGPSGRLAGLGVRFSR